MTVAVFNQKATAYKTGNYPLFGGEEPALYDSINQPYPKFKDLMEQLKELDWSPQDVDLTESRMDLLQMPKEMRELSLLNIAYQWSIDSMATSIPSLLNSFITNTEYGHVIARIGENEMNHADTYSDAIRQCVPDPSEVFAMVHENEKVLDRSEIIGKALSELKQKGAEYTLDMVTFEECMPYILRGVTAIYALERISFMSSFACTFAIAEQGYMVGFSRLVQKILIDEMIHFETQRYALSILMADPVWDSVWEAEKQNMAGIVNGVVLQEGSFNNYLFKEGRAIVGLNEGILNDWTRYCAQEVIDELKLPQDFRKTKTCPLPWFEQDWMDLNAQQNANMESDATNYMVSAVSKDLHGLEFDNSFEDFGDGGVVQLNNKQTASTFTSKLDALVVYSKPNCPFCVKVKSFIEDKGLPYTEVDVSQDEYLLEELKSKMGHKTVPQVYDENGTYYGDCTAFIKRFS